MWLWQLRIWRVAFDACCSKKLVGAKYSRGRPKVNFEQSARFLDTAKYPLGYVVYRLKTGITVESYPVWNF